MLVEPRDVARRDRDRALIEAHCSGDESVFPVIVREHYASLLAHAHRRLGSRVEAEDAVQETFERAYRGLCRVNGEYRIGAWLHRIVANVCYDHAVRRAMQRALPERLGLRLAVTPDVSEHVSDPAVVRAVDDALAALPASQRETFWLYEMNGLSYPEVAEQLGISEDNARARVHRAKAALRRSLSRARDAVAAVIMLPFGVRALRHANQAALSGGAATAPQSAGVTQVAYVVGSTPVTELAVSAASAASSGPNALVIVAASVATVVGGVFAAPVVTGSNSSNGSAQASVAAPAGSDGTSDDVAASATVSIVASTTENDTLGPPTSATTEARARQLDWVLAGAKAVSELDGGSPAAEPSGEPRIDPCPWLADHPDIRAALPGQAPVVGVLDPTTGTTDAGVNIAFSSVSTLRIANEPNGPTTKEVPVSLRAKACLAEGESAIVVDVTGPGGIVVQLRAPLVLRLDEAHWVFRGSVSAPAGGVSEPLPWGLPDRFVALLEVDPTAHSAVLDVVFIGASDATIEPTPPTTAPPEKPEPTPPTTAPATPGTTLPPTPPTTAPSTPPTTAPSGSSSSGSSP